MKLASYDRLSTTFRFSTGSSRLDERGVLDMTRLADFLADKPEGTSVKFVGFTDGIGAFDSNQTLSEGRAAEVMEQLREFAGDRVAGLDLSSTGFGEIAPSACNVNENGRAINRRVEVWIETAEG